MNGSNGSIAFDRYPLDVSGFWAIGGHRLGGGATVHFAPTFKCNASGVCGSSASFDTALGGTIQYGYGLHLGPNGGFDFGVRYTLIRYSSAGLPTQNGSGIGFFFGAGWM